MRYGIASYVLLGSTAVTSIANAQDAPRCVAAQPADATREELIRAAVGCSGAADHAAALALAQRAGALAMTPSLRMLIAEEQERTGDFRAGLVSATQCQADAATAPASATSASELDAIREHCHAITLRIDAHAGRIVLHVPASAPAGLVVRIAGSTIAAPRDGSTLVVAPGDVAVEASAPGHPAWRLEVRAVAGGAVDVSLALPAATTTTTTRTDASSVQPPRTATHALSAGPFVLLGASAAAFAAQIAFFAVRNANVARCTHQANAMSAGCDTQQEVDAPATWNALVFTALGVGSALAVSGAAWLVVSALGSGRRPPSARASVAPIAGGGAWVGFGAEL